MGILKGQTAARLYVETSLDLNSLSIKEGKLKYKKPDGTTGEWDLELEDGKLFVDFTSEIKFALAGDWQFSAYLKFNDDTEAFGEIISYNVGDTL